MYGQDGHCTLPSMTPYTSAHTLRGTLRGKVKLGEAIGISIYHTHLPLISPSTCLVPFTIFFHFYRGGGPEFRLVAVNLSHAHAHAREHHRKDVRLRFIFADADGLFKSNSST